MHRHNKQFPHNSGLKKIIKDFQHTSLSGALTALYSNRIIQQVGAGMIGLFLPILLYIGFGFSIYKVGLYYMVSWLLWFFLVPVGAKIMTRIGLKSSLIISVFFGAGYLFLLRQFEISGLIIFLVFSVFAVNIDRMLYWVPYHTDFAKFTDKRTRGRQMSFLLSIMSLVGVFVPLVAGWVIDGFGYNVLFIIAIMFYLMSGVPFLLIPAVRENFTFSYWRSIKEVFSKTHRKMLLSYGADGMQSVVGMVIWPIFIWLLLDQNYTAVGAVSSFIVLGSIVLRLIVGDFSDRFDKRKVLKWGAILNSIGWLFKMFVATSFQIFIASTYHSFATIVMRTPFDAMMYEQAADSGHYVDEYTVIREMCLAIGRVLMVVLILLSFFLTGSLAVSFLLAALAALLVSKL